MILMSIFSAIGLISIGALIFGYIRATQYEKAEIRHYLGENEDEEQDK